MSNVSVIIPIYNAEQYLSACIDSILNQSYTDFEVLLIDDGSTDKSRKICEDFAFTDNRVKYYHKENGGVSSARNFGLSAATAPYITFIDSDDFIHEKMLETLVKDIAENDFSMCGYEIFDHNKNAILMENICGHFEGNIGNFAAVITDYLNPPFLLSPCFKLFKSKIIKENNILFPLDISYGEDAIFVMKYLMFIKTLKCNSYIGYIYRRHGEETLSQKFIANKMDINVEIDKLIYQFLQYNNCRERTKIYQGMLADNFVSYTHELMCSKLAYKQKKFLFYEKGNMYLPEKAVQGERISYKLISLALRHRFAFFILILFKLKYK